MAARNMIPSSSTRNLLLSSFRDHCLRRLLSSSSESNPNPNPNPSNWPPPVRDMPLPLYVQDIDLGRWVFGIDNPELERFSEKDLYKFIIKAVGESIGSEAQAQKSIYFVSTWKLDIGFGGYFDKETKDKIIKDVEWICKADHDIYYEARESHPTTRQLSLK